MVKPTIIMDIGINHNGDLNIVRELIHKIAKINKNIIIKFQKRDLNICIPEEMKNKPKSTPWGDMTYLEYKQKIEFNKNDYDLIDAICKDVGIRWTASVWDINSYDFLNAYEVPLIKIPSAKITDNDLIQKLKTSKKPIVISTGMSTEEEIDYIMTELKNCDVTILACNSSYPQKLTESNLSYINTLKTKYNTNKVGYSGHELGYIPTVLSLQYKPAIIERHITLNKNMWGSDQKASLDIKDLTELNNIITNYENIIGSGEKIIFKDELKKRESLRGN